MVPVSPSPRRPPPLPDRTMPMPRTVRPFLPLLLAAVAGCDNVGGAFDRVDRPDDPGQDVTTSLIQVVPVGGEVREGRPKVRAAYPADGGWPAVVPIVVVFSESVNEESIRPTSPAGTDGRIVLRVQGTTQPLPCLYDFLGRGRLLIMRPVQALSNEQNPTYEVVLLPEARDCDGVRFDVPSGGTVLTSFQVNQDESFTDGRPLAVFPRDNVRDATRETDVFVVFDRPAVPTSLVAANLFLRPAGGNAVPAALPLPLTTAGVPDSRVVRLDPDALLTAGTEYQLVLTAGVTFGQDGVLDFRGRTPYSRFDTVGPAAPTAIVLENSAAGFPDKINRGNLASARLAVTTPGDARAGDRVRARIYGGDATTTGVGDLAFVERTAELPADGTQTVSVDFSGVLGSLGSPKLDDGALTFAAQLQRGSQLSSFVHQGSGVEPRFDITPPTLVGAGPPGSANGVDLYTDLEYVAFHGRASEPLAAAQLADGVNPAAALFASGDNGRFVVRPIPLGRLAAPRGYSLLLTDRAGNLAVAAATGNIVQRGLLTGTVASTLVVEAYDEATLAPVAGATVLVDPGIPVVPASGQLVGTTDAAGRVTFSGLTALEHTITIVRAGYELVTLYATRTAFASLPLRPRTGATATLSGDVVTPGAGATVLVSTSAPDDRGVLGVRTANASPTTIPETAIVPGRPQVLTAFAGVFEPTSTPTFTAAACNLLGPTGLVPSPPTAAAAGGEQSRQTLTLVPAAGTTGNLLAYPEDFALAAGLDLGSLVGGRPRVRFTASLNGFGTQVLAGVGYAVPAAGGEFELNGTFSKGLLDSLAPFTPAAWVLAEAQDTAGRRSRSRALLVPAFGTTFGGIGPPAIPGLVAPGGPATGAPAVEFADVLDPAAIAGGIASFELVAVDPAGRRWLVLGFDRDPVGGTQTVQFPDLATAGVVGLQTGSWSVQAEVRLSLSVTGATSDDFVLAERVRLEFHAARSAPQTFTVQ